MGLGKELTKSVGALSRRLMAALSQKRVGLLVGLLCFGLASLCLFIPAVRNLFPQEVQAKLGVHFLWLGLATFAFGVGTLLFELLSILMPGPWPGKFRKLKKLHEEGLISKPFYEEAVAELLGDVGKKRRIATLHAFRDWVLGSNQANATVKKGLPVLIDQYLGSEQAQPD